MSEILDFAPYIPVVIISAAACVTFLGLVAALVLPLIFPAERDQ